MIKNNASSKFAIHYCNWNEREEKRIMCAKIIDVYIDEFIIELPEYICFTYDKDIVTCEKCKALLKKK